MRASASPAAEQIAWAFRKLLEQQAPLIVVFDDIQWADETFLDLVEACGASVGGCADPAAVHGAAGVAGAAAGVAGRDPAGAAAGRGGRRADRPISPRVTRARVASAAGGNPLFVTEMLAMAAGRGGRGASDPARIARPPASTSSIRTNGAVLGAGLGGGRDLPPQGGAGAGHTGCSRVSPNLAALRADAS